MVIYWNHRVKVNGIDIDMSDVDSAYDSDYDNEIAPDKTDVMDDIEWQ